MTDKSFLNWVQFESGVYALGHTIDHHEDNIDSIVGIARGGLPGATMLSHALGADLCVIEADLYDGEDRGDEVELGDFSQIPEGDTVIFDDMVDSGDTMGAVKSVVESMLRPDSDVSTASIHVKPNRDLDPEYWVEETEKWVVYPWEVELE